jgi:hypothetical protein
MSTKSDKEKKSPVKAAAAKDPVKKISSKPKKQLEEDDADEIDDEMETSSVSKKSAHTEGRVGKGITSSKKKEEDDDDDEVDDGPDDWEKPEEEEEWDPDFEEFDVPKSKGKKAATGTKKPADDDFSFEDDEFKDLLNDKDYDDDDEEDDY